MEKFEKKKEEGNKVTEVITFTVPFQLAENEEGFTLYTKNQSKPSKEAIIKNAFKFHSQGKISEAKKYYQQFIDEGFNDHVVFSNYGSILKDLGNLKEAEFYTRKAIKLNPNLDIGHYNLGNILNDLGELEEAELSIRKAIEINPNFPVAYFNLGSIMRDLGELEEAELLTRKAIEYKPDYAEAHSNLGNILKDIGKLKEAEKSYSQAIYLNPRLTTAIINRSKLFFQKNEFELALKDADSCNTKESRAIALEALYALGKIDEIYERIEKTSEIDEENIRLAAFSSFIREQEKKDTANNFCRNPLSFLYFSNLSFHVKDYQEFIKEIIDELIKINTVWNPSNLATYNGFQTNVNINLFSKPSKIVSELQSIILNEIDSYYLKFKEKYCTYMNKWPTNNNIFGWHVILKKQGYQEAHIHPTGWLSGVIYLKVVPPLNKNEGAIAFSLNGLNYSDKNSSQLIHQPELGDIVLFPSSLYHRTIPFSTNSDRIVIAFDLRPN